MDESWMKRPSPLTRICIDPRLDRAEDDRASHRGRIGSTTKGLFWKHEAIAHRIADMAATTFAMDIRSRSSRARCRIGRLRHPARAAAAKEWSTVRCWEIIDTTLQIRGGRGYETERSLEARGEFPIPVERARRDIRMNLIFDRGVREAISIRDPPFAQCLPEERHGVPHVEIDGELHARQEEDAQCDDDERAAVHAPAV